MNALTELAFKGLVAAGSLSFSQVAVGLPQATPGVEVALAVKKVQDGTFTLHDLGVLRDSHSSAGRSELHKAFTNDQDSPTKEMIASTLVVGGDQDPSYWNYLENKARAVVGSDAPSPSDFDANGRMSPELSPVYSAWAKAHRLDERQAIAHNFSNLQTMQIFTDTGDRRAIPVLRQGLVSPNLMVVAISAAGLAKLGDDDSEPLIEAVCERAPAAVASDIAIHALYVLHSPVAQQAARRYIPADLLTRLDQERTGQQTQH